MVDQSLIKGFYNAAASSQPAGQRASEARGWLVKIGAASNFSSAYEHEIALRGMRVIAVQNTPEAANAIAAFLVLSQGHAWIVAGNYLARMTAPTVAAVLDGLVKKAWDQLSHEEFARQREAHNWLTSRRQSPVTRVIVDIHNLAKSAGYRILKALENSARSSPDVALTLEGWLKPDGSSTLGIDLEIEADTDELVFDSLAEALAGAKQSGWIVVNENEIKLDKTPELPSASRPPVDDSAGQPALYSALMDFAYSFGGLNMPAAQAQAWVEANLERFKDADMSALRSRFAALRDFALSSTGLNMPPEQAQTWAAANLERYTDVDVAMLESRVAALRDFAYFSDGLNMSPEQAQAWAAANLERFMAADIAVLKSKFITLRDFAHSADGLNLSTEQARSWAAAILDQFVTVGMAALKSKLAALQDFAHSSEGLNMLPEQAQTWAVNRAAVLLDADIDVLENRFAELRDYAYSASGLNMGLDQARSWAIKKLLGEYGA